MKTHIAYCGLDCYQCPAYKATREGDRPGLEAVARRWSTPAVQLTADDITCDGCHSPKPALDCARCEVKRCAEEKRRETCADCPDHECGKLEKTYSEWSGVDAKPGEARANLAALKPRRG